VQVIGELDEKKREALHASWVKVNQDFGSIFTSLLPGTMAKLEPPEGQTFLAGLEVKVCPISGAKAISTRALCHPALHQILERFYMSLLCA